MDFHLYANRSENSDFVYNAFNHFTLSSCNINIAVAFFNEAQLLKDLSNRGCPIRIVVRLDHPTSPKALKKISESSGIQIRYVTGRSFHPKLYIFGDNVALIGSANLTSVGIRTNQEVMVTIPSDDPRFEELTGLFSDYWDQAKVLTSDILDEYTLLYDKHLELDRLADSLRNDINNKIGRVVINNIDRGLPKQSKENIFIHNFRRTYQEILVAYNVVKDVYLSVGKRKHTDDEIPLRLEIDSFITKVSQKLYASV